MQTHVLCHKTHRTREISRSEWKVIAPLLLSVFRGFGFQRSLSDNSKQQPISSTMWDGKFWQELSLLWSFSGCSPAFTQNRHGPERTWIHSAPYPALGASAETPHPRNLPPFSSIFAAHVQQILFPLLKMIPWAPPKLHMETALMECFSFPAPHLTKFNTDSRSVGSSLVYWTLTPGQSIDATLQ